MSQMSLDTAISTVHIFCNTVCGTIACYSSTTTTSAYVYIVKCVMPSFGALFANKVPSGTLTWLMRNYASTFTTSWNVTGADGCWSWLIGFHRKCLSHVSAHSLMSTSLYHGGVTSGSRNLLIVGCVCYTI